MYIYIHIYINIHIYIYICIYIYIYTHVRQATPGYEFVSHKVFMKSLRDQICITLRPQVNCVRKVDF